jgi:Fe2+ or Zn2+ uptake regulation protein
MDPKRNELTRNEVLAYLAERQAIAQTAETILRRVNKENNFTLPEIELALSFLENAQLIKSEPDPLGSSKYWQATSTGVLHYERSL